MPDQQARETLQRILDSHTFAGTRRLRDFLSYAGRASLDGREELDQYEIADKVLQRDPDFDPLTDSSVRKLASQLRHKLEEYYAQEGVQDQVVIALPTRSYVPRFRPREQAPAIERSLYSTAVQVPSSREYRPYIIGFLAGALLVIVALWQHSASRVFQLGLGSQPGLVNVIRTSRGDLRGPLADVAKGAVLLGSPIRDGEDVAASVNFTPQYATHQAGIMIFESPDWFVRLGHQFKTRALLEFGAETGGQYREADATFEFDPLGQANSLRWFSIRREGARYSAFISSNGFEWRPFGRPVEQSGSGHPPRAAIYAFNGRSEAPAADAAFSGFSAGLAFHHRPERVIESSDFPGWHVRTRCSETMEARVHKQALEVGFPEGARGCAWTMTRTAPSGEWTFSTHLDFVPVSGTLAGLGLWGERGSVAMTRRDLNRGSILLEQPNDNDTGIPDFPGTPPLWLRLRVSGGWISGSVSRDGQHFVDLPQKVPAEAMGKLLRVGIVTSTALWNNPGRPPSPRFYRLQQEIDSPQPLNGNVTGKK